MSKVQSYVDQIIARLSGDADQVIAIKNQRTAQAEVKYQLAALESEKLKCENNVEKAQEDFENALYPTTLISNGSDFCNDLKSSQQRLENAEEELENIKHSIIFFNGILDKVNS